MVNGFISASGRELIDGRGHKVLLRGVGLGSWFLPEGYMWKMPAEADRPRRMEKLILYLVGPQSAAEFWETYWDNFISEADIQQIAVEGFNSLRLPINARYLTGSDDSSEILESRIARVDQLIEWCGHCNVYIVLDLHGAPGGQTGTNIDDSEYDRPDLFINQENEDRTVEIWRALATRYKDEPIIAGYDLLNEPLPNWFSEYNKRVLPLYRRIVEAIRRVDSRHLIILEGVHWATDWSIFAETFEEPYDEPFDDNVMLQFHKYWNNPDKESIALYTEARDKWNLPIYMGEGGENNADWYSGAFRLFEDLDISWNFWTWKKLDTHNSPLSISTPKNWSRLVDAAKGEEHLERDEALTILGEYLEKVKFDNCVYHPEVVRSLFRSPPVRIPAIFYSYRDRGQGFEPGPVKDNQPELSTAALIDFRRADGMPFGYLSAGENKVGATHEKPHFAHNGGEPWEAEEWMFVQLNPGAWVAYDFNAAHSSGSHAYNLTLRMRALPAKGTADATVQVSIDGIEQSFEIALEKSEGFLEYQIDFTACPGQQRVTVYGLKETVQLQYLYVSIPD
ncbi:MAG: glycoside hydrolase family 5 protein [Spirochaetia bacterium]|nr:glycoside hydrolase family 5 protein [Spirochaetia bacterium]